MTPLERQVLAYVAEKRWRGEVGVCLHFGKVDQHGPTVDALFHLVRYGFLEWFGAEDDGSKPMRYRVTAAGRTELALAREAGAT